MPQSEGAALAALDAGAVVSGKHFEGNLAYFHAVGPASLLGRYRRFREKRSVGEERTGGAISRLSHGRCEHRFRHGLTLPLPRLLKLGVPQRNFFCNA